MALVVGIDAGGTFTDLIARDTQSGRTYSRKVPSSPENPANAIIDGIQSLISHYGLEGIPIALIAHGTTVGTNALLQRNGARVALITTKGFRDLLEIGRQTRPFNYDIYEDFPPPVVPRQRRFEVAERVGSNGDVVTCISQSNLEEVISSVLQTSAEAVAIAFIFGYLNPVHERKAQRAIQTAAPGMFVSVSSEVQPEFREYERISTTVLNAYLQPTLAQYLDALSAKLATNMPTTRVAVSRSNGGLMSLPMARSFPVRTALSGPAAGVVGAIEIQKSLGRGDAITFDMGGTSADVALVQGYSCKYKHNSTIGGFPLRMSMLDIHTVGAGGGSVAWIDEDELLKVGPRSAGASPGPACYGLGGLEPTVSDANMALGRLSPHGLLGGAMRVYPELAQAAISRVARKLNLSLETTAKGILDIVTSNMVRAIRAITVERGFDPRDFLLLAFGGAGPLHARQVAAALGISQILVPRLPGILCAQGALASPFKEDLVRTTKITLRGDSDDETLRSAVDELLKRASNWSVLENLPGSTSTSVVLDMRYVGQNFELAIPLDQNELRQLPSAEHLRRRFLDEHHRQYRFHDDSGPVEIVNVRLTVEARSESNALDALMPATTLEKPQVASRRVVFNGEEPVPTPVFERECLIAGQTLTGPAVIEQSDATTLLFPGDCLEVDSRFNLIIEVRR